ncbi:MAG: hypothetical protein M3252_00750 [Actinomycetota bacterium]|nr:hypothetical protein [Actinomycetota bacterium]
MDLPPVPLAHGGGLPELAIFAVPLIIILLIAWWEGRKKKREDEADPPEGQR